MIFDDLFGSGEVMLGRAGCHQGHREGQMTRFAGHYRMKFYAVIPLFSSNAIKLTKYFQEKCKKHLTKMKKCAARP